MYSLREWRSLATQIKDNNADLTILFNQLAGIQISFLVTFKLVFKTHLFPNISSEKVFDFGGFVIVANENTRSTDAKTGSIVLYSLIFFLGAYFVVYCQITHLWGGVMLGAAIRMVLIIHTCACFWQLQNKCPDYRSKIFISDRLWRYCA